MVFLRVKKRVKKVVFEQKIEKKLIFEGKMNKIEGVKRLCVYKMRKHFITHIF